MLKNYDIGTFIGAFAGMFLIATAIFRGGGYQIFLSLKLEGELLQRHLWPSIIQKF